MRRLRGTSLLEAIVAAVLFLLVFASVMELMPRLAVRNDDAVLLAEAHYRTSRTFEKYASGGWHCGAYVHRYDWGEITVRISAWRGLDAIREIEVEARIEGSVRVVRLKQLAACSDRCAY